MLIGIIGENCSGKSTLAEKMKDVAFSEKDARQSSCAGGPDAGKKARHV